MATQDNRIGKLSTDLGPEALVLLGLSAHERLSESYTITIDAYSETPQPVHTLLGTDVGVAFASQAPYSTRDFAGILWEYSELGQDHRGYHYRLVLRPANELMTLNRRNRIFQNLSAVDIVTTLIVGDYKTQLSSYDLSLIHI